MAFQFLHRLASRTGWSYLLCFILRSMGVSGSCRRTTLIARGFGWSALIVVGAALTVVELAVAQDVLVVPFVMDSVVAIQSAAERIVSDYVAVITEVTGDPSYVPTIEIVNTPNLAYFNRRTGQIVLPHWASMEGPSRDFFASLSWTEAQAEELFTMLFNWFLVAHELTHWFQQEAGITLDRYSSEAMANHFAVAFHMRAAGGEERLLRLEELLEGVLFRLVDPTPEGEDAAAFFNANYAALARDPSCYGYYQFRFILDSIAHRDELDFEMLVSQYGGQS